MIVPLPSPASGFTYEFDPTLGVFRRTTQSFGPILADRADTVGARRVSLGFASQRFTFDTVEDLDLRQVPALFTHDNAHLLGGREDVVTTVNSIEVAVNQFTSFVTFGVTDRLDVSVALPLLTNEVTVVSEATVQRLGTTNPLTHFFRLSDGEVGNRRLFTAFGSASGLGDVTVRLKGRIARRGAAGFAAGVDVRLPTGDHLNLLGTGAVGVKPFGIASAMYGSVSPHLNVSYEWNGSSVLAGNPATGRAADFPDQVAYAAGADVRANSRLTLAFDLLGRFVIDAERLRRRDFLALDGRSVFPTITFSRDSFNALSGAIGFKLNAFERVLINANLLVALDHHGVRDRVSPLVSLEYAF